MQIYNTLTRKKEELIPLQNNLFRIYSCGPTVYDYVHIGNLRAFVCADILKRYLIFKGYKVKHVMNITDVDDKTIKKANGDRQKLKEITEFYAKAFFEDLKEMNILPADVYPKATEHIKDMVNVIKTLMAKGYAYKAEDGSIYFSVAKFKDYGKLSKIKIAELKAGARVSQDEYAKESAADFALWKAWKESDGDVFWETELGKGRPGWHIECSVMSTKYLGQPFDIHTGGVDLIFPHHENEIAQSEAYADKEFVRYWIHNEWLFVEGKKMSKSLGNFYTLRDLKERGYSGQELRLVFLETHYRQQLDFSLKQLDAAKSTLERIKDFTWRMKNNDKEEGKDLAQPRIDAFMREFTAAMDDDLDTPKALAALHSFIHEINLLDLNREESQKVYSLMKQLENILGLTFEFELLPLTEEELALIKEREKARKQKDWQKADAIREELKKRGIELFDTKERTKWRKVKQ